MFFVCTPNSCHRAATSLSLLSFWSGDVLLACSAKAISQASGSTTSHMHLRVFQTNHIRNGIFTIAEASPARYSTRPKEAFDDFCDTGDVILS